MGVELLPRRVSDVDRNPPLTASDRCDRCGSAAQVRTMHEVTARLPVFPKDTTTVTGTLSLLWCIHHFEAHQDALAPYLVFMSPLAAKNKVKT